MIDEDVILRRAATQALGREPDEEDARVLLSLLSDPDARVHTAAAEALGAHKVEIARDDYRLLLDEALRHRGEWHAWPDGRRISGREALAEL